MTRNQLVSSPKLLRVDFTGATKCPATKCRIRLYDITTQWYIGNLIFMLIANFFASDGHLDAWDISRFDQY